MSFVHYSSYHNVLKLEGGGPGVSAIRQIVRLEATEAAAAVGGAAAAVGRVAAAAGGAAAVA